MAAPTPTGTELQISTDSGFNTLVNTTTSTTYRVSDSFVKDDLPYGETLYARVRHNSSELGYSKWSPVITFQIAVPSNVIGVCLNNRGTKGQFFWIDAKGNQLEEFDWQNHPTYKNIECVTIDGCSLTRFPKFYCKTTASGPAGTFADGLKCWWISDVYLKGFRPHACFKRSTAVSNGKYVVSDYCYMGRYLGHQETVRNRTCIGSKVNQTVLASTTKADFKTYITNRNYAAYGVSGFRMFDIWDLGALRMLLLIAKADSDTQSCWGDNSAGIAYPKTGSTNARACFKGTHSNPTVSIEDLWRCYWYHADLITVNNGVVTLTSPMDLTSTLSFGSAATSRYTQPTTSGWIRDVLDCPFTIGNDTHDLLELFLPGTVVSAENQGTFSDYHGASTSNPVDNLVVTGGYHNSTPSGGIFLHDPEYFDLAFQYVGSRISKN